MYMYAYSLALGLGIYLCGDTGTCMPIAWVDLDGPYARSKD